MRDDYAIAADLCEEHGLAAPAGVLRQIADGSGEVFMVRPDEATVALGDLAGPLVDSALRTRRLFPTREAAERCAADLRVKLLREYSYRLSERQWIFTVPFDEFCRQVGAILGFDYRPVFDYRADRARSGPIFPDWASDEQLRAIAPLLRDRLVEVVGVPFDGEEG